MAFVHVENGGLQAHRLKRAQPADSRVWVNRSDLEVNLGDWESIEQYDGYAGVTTNIFRASAW